jgi:lipopolysaccharide/colanic/teichoic acid biosynthesis glycosyltransferase
MPSRADGVYSSALELDYAAVERLNPLSSHLVLVRSRTSSRAMRARRVLNVSIALLSMIVVAPVMLLIALAVKLTSPGPVLYRQVRVGLDRRKDSGGNWRRGVDYGGRLFTMYKFRTMYMVPEQQAMQVWASPDDPRVTPVGRFLRNCRLDELPQLYNVIRGDMNIVGPRPEQPEIFADLRDRIQRYPERQRVLPGITGLAQISQAYDRHVDDVKSKLAYDLAYTERQSAMEDLRIMLRTLPVVLFGRGAW